LLRLTTRTTSSITGTSIRHVSAAALSHTVTTTVSGGAPSLPVLPLADARAIADFVCERAMALS
jgi:hypothetical protein